MSDDKPYVSRFINCMGNRGFAENTTGCVDLENLEYPLLSTEKP